MSRNEPNRKPGAREPLGGLATLRRRARRPAPSTRWVWWAACPLALTTFLPLTLDRWSDDTPAHPERAVLAVAGLHCHVWCPVRVDGVVQELDDVRTVTIDVDRGEVVIEFDGSTTDAATVATHLALNGWPAEVIEAP